MNLKLFAALCAAVLAPLHALAVDWSKPWIEPQDSLAAATQTDEYAWRLFVMLNWPANLATREADASKKLGDAGPVVWETWKNAREVYLAGGADPGPWLTVSATVPTERRFDPEPLQQLLRRRPSAMLKPRFDPIAANPSSPRNETRLNRATYEFIRSNDLFHLDGQLLAYDLNKEIAFPALAKETKAQWRVIDSKDRERYHTVEVKNPDGTTTLFGLTALHITTKDLPNWLWATFEHVDNPKRPGNEQWMLSSVDRFACKGAAPDCNRAPAGIGLEGTKWMFYRLRGTQIDFTDARGNATMLANSQPESGFQTSSSCITCHSRASIGRPAGQPARLSVFDISSFSQRSPVALGEAPGFVGVPKYEWFYADTDDDGRRRLFLQLDFVWSLFRAQPKAK